jgi:DNA-binding NarL/FixJ family response regulator
MTIFVVDDHPLLREAVVMMIRRLNGSLNVVELDRMAAIGPAVHGVSGVRELKQQMPEVPLLVLSAASAQDFEDLALEAGAQAFLTKSAGAAEISSKLRSLIQKEGQAPTAAPSKLSKRQKQLLHMLDKGLSNRDIAAELEISEHTVKVHLWRLFRRLDVKSRSQASHLARSQGLV